MSNDYTNLKQIHFQSNIDTIIIDDFCFSPVHIISEFNNYTEFDFYLDYNKKIYLLRFNDLVNKDTIEIFTDKFNPVSIIVIRKLNQSIELNLKHFISLFRKNFII